MVASGRRVDVFDPGGCICVFRSSSSNLHTPVSSVIMTLKLIQMILFIGGVEQNPGPQDEFIFRYQYVLINIGGMVMRKIFDNKTGQNLGNFLSACQNVIQQLGHNKIITPDQLQLLPPIEPNPKSANFDITLLFCLLRNVCGLKHNRDPVWRTPLSTDTSLEANLVRLKDCRNSLQHIGTVFISPNDLTTKWTDLSQILNDLNVFSNIVDLQKQITDAEHMDIDPELRKRFDQVLKSWKDMDGRIEDLEQSVAEHTEELAEHSEKLADHSEKLAEHSEELAEHSEKLAKHSEELAEHSEELGGLKRKVDQLEETVEESKRSRSDMGTDMDKNEKDIRARLVTKYKEECCLLSVSPLCYEDDDAIDILSIYQPPSLYEEPYLRTHEQHTKDPITSYEEIFKAGDKSFRKVFITGNAGVGKTSLCQRMAYLWCKSQSGEGICGDKEDDDSKSNDFNDEPQLSIDTTGRKSERINIDICVSSDLKCAENELKDHGNSEIRPNDTDKDATKSNNSEGKADPLTETGKRESSDQVDVNVPNRNQHDVNETKKEAEESNDDDLSGSSDKETSETNERNKNNSVHLNDKSDSSDSESLYYNAEENSVMSESIDDAGSISLYSDSLDSSEEELSDSNEGERDNDKSVHNDMTFLAKFDFLFYISLGKTGRKDVVKMIVDQYLYTEDNDEICQTYKRVKDILKENKYSCIIVMDAFDEWSPYESWKIDTSFLSEKCTILTTCRPYKIETERLTRNDIDRQISMKGMNRTSINRYVTKVLGYMNNVNKTSYRNKASHNGNKPEDFIRDTKSCGIKEHLIIPIICSHLIGVWFEYDLTEMSLAKLYSFIVEMLLKRAETEKKLSVSSTCEMRIPESLSDMFYFERHGSLLKRISLLSFNILFKQDSNLTEFVFTPEQLASKPYTITVEEVNILCKYGILTKSKKISPVGKQNIKLAYLHKTYLEYFAALFVSSFDPSNVFSDVVKSWNTVDDVLQFEQFILFYVGFDYQQGKRFIEDMFESISDYLNSRRRDIICYPCSISLFFIPIDSVIDTKKLSLLQTIVLNCCREMKNTNNEKQYTVKLEDFIFDHWDLKSNKLWVRENGVNILCRLAEENNVKSLFFNDSLYSDCASILRTVKKLECLSLENISADKPTDIIKCMLQNSATLHTVNLRWTALYIQEFPVRSLHNLSSLRLCYCNLSHGNFQDLVDFLSDNVQIENLCLENVMCEEHHKLDGSLQGTDRCSFSLKLEHCENLKSLCLRDVHIVCHNLNSTNLKVLILKPVSEGNYDHYAEMLRCIQNSQTERLDIFGFRNSELYDSTIAEPVAGAVSTLPCLKFLRLESIKFSDNVLLHLHPDVKEVEIDLWYVKMSEQCVDAFIDSFINRKSMIKVKLTLNDCDYEEYIRESLRKNQNVIINDTDLFGGIHFTTKCQQQQ